MLALTKKVGYGLIALTHLARQEPEALSSAREIAEQFGVPTSLLMNILKDLGSAGLVASVRGARGGYRLAREPHEITLADLITVLEGPIRLAECITGDSGDGAESPCSLMQRCPILDPVHRVHRRVHDFMRQLTLAEIAESEVPTGADETTPAVATTRSA